MAKTTIKLLIDSQNNNLTFSKNFRIFSTTDPICGITKFTDFLEDLTIATPNTLDLTKLTRSFRYSRNRLDWSLWYEIIPPNLGDADDILMDDCDDFYFEIKYTYDDGTSDELSTPIIINEIKLRFNQKSTVSNTFSPKVLCSDEKCSSIIQNRDPSFRPYNVDSAIGMYQELSYFTNQLYGHQVVYFRTLPESDSGDFVFKEWTLYKNIDRKCIKVMVKDNVFPENTPKYADYGIGFQLPFEIEVDHRYFQSIFGTNSEPRKRDFLYFPLLNRMYEIQGSFLHRGFMMAPTYWKIQLKKYNPNIDMLLTDDTRSFLDNVILSGDQLFADEVKADIADATMPAQYSKITTTFDSSRKAIHPDIIQRPLKYTFNFAPLIENYYDLGNIEPLEIKVNLTSDVPAISTSQQVESLPDLDKEPSQLHQSILAYHGSPLYQYWKNGELRTFDKNTLGVGARYCRIRGPFDTIEDHIGQSESGRYVRIDAYRSIKLNDRRDILVDSSGATDIATFKLKESAIIYNALPKFNTTDSKNLSFTCLFNVPSTAETINFIDGYSDELASGIRVSAVFTRYSATLPEGDLTITLLINSQSKVYTVNNFTSTIWHSLVISVSNEFKQCGVYVYQIKDDPSDIINHNGFIRKLSTIASFTQEQFDLDQNYTIMSSQVWLSNIRLFNTMLKEEDHDFILSQQFLKDESMLLLIDNCRVQSNLPYIAKNR